MSEIKPCPLCNNTKLTVSFSHECGRWDVYTVECGACCVSKDSALGFEGDAARQAAIDAWNHRPIEDDLTASLNRASDACASVQKERDELREMLGEAAAILSAALADDDGFSLDEAFIWERPIEKRPLVTYGMLRKMRAAFLARYEGAKA